MEEIDLMRLLDYYKHKVVEIIFIVFCVTVMIFVYGAFLQKPMYQSHTTVILGGNEKDSTSLTQNDVTLNKNLVDTYAEVVKSRRVLEQVISSLHLNMSYEQLEGMVSVVSVNNTEIIKIKVISENANKARVIADEIADFFIKEVTKLYKLNNVNVLDKAVVAVKPYNINYKKTIIVAFAVGVVVAFGIIFIIYYFDRTIKSVEMVEQITGLPILGTIRELKKKDRRKS